MNRHSVLIGPGWQIEPSIEVRGEFLLRHLAITNALQSFARARCHFARKAALCLSDCATHAATQEHVFIAFRPANRRQSLFRARHMSPHRDCSVTRLFKAYIPQPIVSLHQTSSPLSGGLHRFAEQIILHSTLHSTSLNCSERTQDLD